MNVIVAFVPRRRQVLGANRPLVEGGDKNSIRALQRNIGIEAVDIVGEALGRFVLAQSPEVHVERAVLLHEENDVLDLAERARAHYIHGYRAAGVIATGVSRGRRVGSRASGAD